MVKSILISPKLYIIIICLLFLLTRIYKISEIPSSVYWDEASLGYNAYSVLKTGKDEWGDFLPLHFRAFGEFKLPVYIYSIVPFIFLFDLNSLSVRLPAVFFSLGSVILVFLLTKKITQDKLISTISAFFITISPWFFIFSRTGYEATAGLMFYLLGVYLFLFNSKNSLFIIISTISFVLSAYSYNSFRIIIPLTVLILLIVEFTNLKNNLKKSFIVLIIAFIFFAISSIPILKLYIYDAGLSRLQIVSGGNNLSTIASNYLSHFSFEFLLRGDKNPRSQQPGFGQLYFIDLFFILMGVIFIIKSKNRHKLLPLALLLIAPIPAIITKESPHALRSISAAPFICIVSAMGLVFIAKLLRYKYFVSILIVFYIVFFANYFWNFLKVYPNSSSEHWQYGYKEINTAFDKQLSMFISDEYAQPYIFTLFYLKYNPDKFRREVVRNSVSEWGFSTVSKFGQFKYGKINRILSQDLDKGLVFVSREEQLKQGIHLQELGEIKFLDGSTAFKVYKK